MKPGGPCNVESRVLYHSVMFLHRRRGSTLHCHGDAGMFGKSLHRHASRPIHGNHRRRCLCTERTIRAGSTSRDELYDLLRRCTSEKDIALGRHVHCSMMITTVGGGLDSINVLGDHLIRMFSRCGGSPLEASLAFSKVLRPSVYTWNAILSAVAGASGTVALELYRKMREDGVTPVERTFLPLLAACAHEPMLSPGRLIHEQLVRNGYESNLFVGSALIDMYSKCGSFGDGSRVFGSMRRRRRDAGIYGAMISACIDHGRVDQASRLLGGMLEEGIPLSPSMLGSVLKACDGVRRVASLHTCIIIIISSSSSSSSSSSMSEGEVGAAEEEAVALGNGLIEAYASFGALGESRRVFSGMRARDAASWAALAAGYAQHGCRDEAVQLLAAMTRAEGGERVSGGGSLRSVLRACADVRDLRLGRWFHDRAVRSDDAGGVVCSLIDMYARCRSLEEARRVFDVHRGASSSSCAGDRCSAMMGGYASGGDGDGALELFERVLREGVEASRGMLLGAARACCCSAYHASIRACLWVHDRIVRARLEAETDIASALVGGYARKLGRVEEARKVFDAMPRHDAVSFGAMIGGYADCELGLSGLALFREMMQAESGIEPDRLAHVSAVRACSSSSSQRGMPLKEGRWIHHSIVERAHDDDDDAAIGSALVDMYAACGSLGEAEAVFGRLRRRDAAAWAVLIGGYVRNGLADAALRLFGRMHRRHGLSPSQSTVSSLLKACEMLGSAGRGMVLHALAVESGHAAEAATASSLIAFYCAVGSLHDASSVFGGLPKGRDVVTWGAMIAGHVARGNGADAMASFEAMAREGCEPDSVACILLLQACAEVGAAAHGRLLHGRMIARGLESGAECEHALVAMYARCGRLEDARRVLARSQAPGVASWGALLAAHAHLGDTASLPRLLRGMMIDDVIFLSALAACARSGALEEGTSYFGSMIEAHSMMMPQPKHYNCLVDLLGRSGSLLDAHDLLRCVPRAPDIIAWLALLSACSVHYNTGLGAGCYDAIVSCGGRHDASGPALMSSLRSSLEPSSSLLSSSPSFG